MGNTFKMGGIHPLHEKLSATQSIFFGEVPDQLLIPVHQHIGSPSEIVVAKGDEISRGDLVAKSTGFVSSNVHSPVNGKVQKIIKFPQLGGKIGECVALTPANAGENFEKLIENDKIKEITIENLSTDEIRNKISEAGIIGMGGAGFPTHVKLSPPPEKKINSLIINGAECEPFITSDHRVMLEQSSELLKGILILQKLFSGVPVYIGIEKNKPDAIQSIQKEIAKYNNIYVVPLKVKYPQGGEKQLIKAILDREVPSKGLPMDVGVVVQNVATVIAIYNAIYYDRSLTERVVTIAGNIVKNPGNIMLPIGTPVSYVFHKFGIDKADIKLFISGGPMMGKTSYSFESPVSKTTSALLFFDENYLSNQQENPCIRCGNCIKVCPMGLTVTQYVEMIRANNIDPSIKDSIMDCIECGCCSYSCPANIKLVQWMRFGKNIIKREN